MASRTITSSDGSPPSASPQSGLRLVFGASGYIGSNLVPALLRHNIPVRACSRRPEVLRARDWSGVEVVGADALAPSTLAPALEGVDTAYYLIHSMTAGADFASLERQAATHFADAAAAAGVRQIVYLGALVPEGADSAHILSRRDTGEALRRGQVPVIELRAAIIVGPGSAAFEVMRDLVLHLPVMVTPRWVRAKSPPIALDNLLEYLIRLPDQPAAQGGIFEAGGPQQLTYEAMMRILAEEAGKPPPRILAAPVLSPRFSSYWLKFVTSVPTNVARALIEGLKYDFSAETEPLQALVPLERLDFRASVAAALARERQHDVEARWVEGAYSIRRQRNDYAYYAKRAAGHATSCASADALWRVITAIGGENRYYYFNSLWALRELLDWLVGGPGMRRQRRHPTELRVGDRVDSWEVIGMEHERRLTLAFGMKAPGAGVLEIEIEPLEAQLHQVTATAYWHPAGALGLAYWFSLQPAHLVIFKGLTREICRRAEALEQ
ncbi:SDR family oxidoreductase [Motiliproteus sp. SC1-56]|uniref:SDR family oxidoreductase n=1 Tax=Motiliproteus sp. SC1-56 TaxID=2799565 RepID=UPI001A8FB0F2|nr:SDR family oxidoreductase [Motiliproteus sp. SC1-56]